MTNEELVVQKLDIISKHGKNIQGKTYPSTQKNEMARAIYFQYHWAQFQTLIGTFKKTLTDKEEKEVMRLLDALINVCEATPAYWESFWQGKEVDNPQKMPFVSIRGEQLRFIDLTTVAKITIPFLGFN